MITPPPSIHLGFSDKYDRQHAEHYLRKHQDGIARRLSHRRDLQLARAALALAGEPRRILDLPCGAGRFWEMLLEDPRRELIAADNSADMIAVALANQAAVSPRVRTLQTSAFAIDLPDASVDSIFCMRLMHHVQRHDDRMRMLHEFHRVTRDTVIVSLWVEGNFKAWRRRRQEHERGERSDPNRVIIPAARIEAEFREAGFSVLDNLDFLPHYAMWRVYIVRKD